MEKVNGTPFQDIYSAFYSKVTDDMYLEWTQEDTERDLCNVLLASIPRFEFPRFKLYDYSIIETLEEDESGALMPKQTGSYNSPLTREEINILATIMVSEWFVRQIATIDNTRMKYSSSDFKFTSQANHLDKLTKAKAAIDLDIKRLQRLYKRRKTNDDGYIVANYSGFGGRADAYN